MSNFPTSWAELFDRLPKVRGGLDISRCKDLLVTVIEYAKSNVCVDILMAKARTFPLCPRFLFVDMFEAAMGTTDATLTERAIDHVCNAPCRDILVTWTIAEMDGIPADGIVVDDEGSVVLERAFVDECPSVTFHSYGMQYEASFDRMRCLDVSSGRELNLLRSSDFGLDDNYVAQDEIVTICSEGRLFHIPLQCVMAHPHSLLAKHVARRGTRATFRVSGIPPYLFQYIVDYFTSGIVEMDEGLSSHMAEDVKVLMRWDVPLDVITLEKATREDVKPRTPQHPPPVPMQPASPERTRENTAVPGPRPVRMPPRPQHQHTTTTTPTRFVVDDDTPENFQHADNKKNKQQQHMGKGSSENVLVVVRLRPLNEKEKKAGHTCASIADLSSNTINVTSETGDSKAWAFDQVFTDVFTQRDIYLQTAHPLVESVIQGYNATVFAYGQSGTGKTFTMTGVIEKPGLEGIIPNALNHIFSQVNAVDSTKQKYIVQVSYVELYNGRCRDLLQENKQNLEIKENSQKVFYVKDLSLWDVTDATTALRLMDQGMKNREVKATELNADSSRSHSIFAVHIKCHDIERDVRTESKLNLVDLAGSERQSKTQAAGETLKEGSNINLSLTALGTVIDCVVKGKPHIPFRSSPLTMLLKDALGGGSRTLLFGNVGPAEHNTQETMSTLRFVDRAKQIKNKPKMQMDPKDQRIMELTEENNELKRRLGMKQDSASDDDADDADDAPDEREETPVLQKSVSMHRRKSSLKEVVNQSWDSEMNALKRRIDELEVALETTERESIHLQEDLEISVCKERNRRASVNVFQEDHKRVIANIQAELDLALAERDDVKATLKELLDAVFDLLQLCLSEKEKGEWSGAMEHPDQTLKTRAGPNYMRDIQVGLRMAKESGAKVGLTLRTSKKTLRSKSKELASIPVAETPPARNIMSADGPMDGGVLVTAGPSQAEIDLRRELDNAQASLECQRSVAGKVKDALDAKTEESTRLKEHVNAMRAELKKVKEQNGVEMQDMQEKLVLQTNKRIEKLVTTHAMTLAKATRQSEKLQEKIRRGKDQFQVLQQEYDVKVLEYEQVHRDQETMKVDHMKKMKDWGMFAPVGKSHEELKQKSGIAMTPQPNAVAYLPVLENGRIVSTQPSSVLERGDSFGDSSSSTLPARVPHPPSLFSRNFLEIRK